jgi:sugar (pentulose or hexulose) kinase
MKPTTGATTVSKQNHSDDDALILAIDSGTQSVRTLLFDLQGNLVARTKVDLEPLSSPEPGWAEQDVVALWRSLCEACQQLWSEIGDQQQRIVGLALTSQRGTVVNVDDQGNPLRPAISWLDQRRSSKLPPIGKGWDWLFKVVGQEGLINFFRAQAESNWLRRQQPEIWNSTAKYLLLSGYLNYRLCGEYVDSVASQVGYIPFSYQDQCWSPSWSWKWRATGIDQDHLPRLVRSGERLGEVSSEAAEQTGLPLGLPIIAAAADKACEVIGSGCLSPDQGAISYGTTATINTTSKKYVEAIRYLPAYPSAVPGSYCTEIQVFRGFWMVNWFKQQFGLAEQLEAERSGEAPEFLFDKMIADVPPGSMGLMLQPYWTPGIKLPGPEAKGSIIGFGDVHGREHVYRAMLEGLAYGLREGAERIEKRSGTSIKTLRVSGGGSQSDRMMQITADVFGLPAERPHTYETSGLGAAIVAAVGLGLYPDFNAAIDGMSHSGDRFEPDSDAHQIYDQLYQQVYCKMYDRLSPLFKSVQKITGYPAVD